MVGSKKLPALTVKRKIQWHLTWSVSMPRAGRHLVPGFLISRVFWKGEMMGEAKNSVYPSAMERDPERVRGRLFKSYIFHQLTVWLWFWEPQENKPINGIQGTSKLVTGQSVMATKLLRVHCTSTPFTKESQHTNTEPQEAHPPAPHKFEPEDFWKGQMQHFLCEFKHVHTSSWRHSPWRSRVQFSSPWIWAGFRDVLAMNRMYGVMLCGFQD